MPPRPKLVLVGQLSYLPWVFDSATRAGIDLILVPRGDDRVRHEDLPESVVELLPLALDGDPEQTLRVLARRYERDPFDGIIAGDGGVPFVARAARLLGLTGLTDEAAAVVRDKRKMRARLRAGLPTPGFVALAAPGDWRDALGLRFPVVVKPVNGYSSLGVTKVSSPAELEAAVARVGRLAAGLADGRHPDRASLLVEEYLDGLELTAESLAHHGQVRVCGISYKSPMTGPYFEETMLRAPATLPADVVAAVEREVVAAHAAFGVTEGTTHTDCGCSTVTGPSCWRSATAVAEPCTTWCTWPAGSTWQAKRCVSTLGSPTCWTPPAAERPCCLLCRPVGPGGRFRGGCVDSRELSRRPASGPCDV